MARKLIVHLRDNVVAYIALSAALGGTSYAAVHLAPGSVTSRALAPGAVTHDKLAPSSITSANIRRGSLTRAAFARGILTSGANGANGATGSAGASGKNGTAGANGGSGTAGTVGRAGPAGPQGPTGTAGANGSSAIALHARGAGSVNAPHGASTDVPMSDATWTQAPGELDLVTGTARFKIPSSCTGSFGNSLVLSVDGTPATFAVAPSAPAGSTVTMPFIVTPAMEPSGSTSHRVSASLANSCTKGGEDYTVDDVKVDVVSFR
jgi:hypothetical protein